MASDRRIDTHSQWCWRCVGAGRKWVVETQSPHIGCPLPPERKQETRGPAVLNNGPAPHQPGLKRPHSVSRLSEGSFQGNSPGHAYIQGSDVCLCFVLKFKVYVCVCLYVHKLIWVCACESSQKCLMVPRSVLLCCVRFLFLLFLKSIHLVQFVWTWLKVATG